MAIEVCKQLYPDYASFHRRHAWGDPVLLLDGSRCCEEWAAGKEDPAKVRDLRSRIEAVIPDTDDFGDFDGSYALNASAAVAYALQYLIDRSLENTLHIATLYYDTIDFKLQESGISSDLELEGHSMMVEARRFLLGEGS